MCPSKPRESATPNFRKYPPPLEDAPVHAGTHWPGPGKMSSSLFIIRKYWPVLPSTNTSTNITIKPNPPTIKMESQDPNQSKPGSTATKPEKCRWGSNCPICKNAEEDSGAENQKQLQQSDVQQRYPPQG